MDSYSFNPSQGEFAYSASNTNYGHVPSVEEWGTNNRSVRPSTSTSSLSAISQTSSSQAATPPVEGYAHAGESNVTRCEYFLIHCFPFPPDCHDRNTVFPFPHFRMSTLILRTLAGQKCILTNGTDSQSISLARLRLRLHEQ